MTDGVRHLGEDSLRGREVSSSGLDRLCAKGVTVGNFISNSVVVGVPCDPVVVGEEFRPGCRCEGDVAVNNGTDGGVRLYIVGQRAGSTM